MAFAKRSKANLARPLHLKRSGPSSDVESAHWGAPPSPGPSASSSNIVALPPAAQGGEVARASKRVCGVPCNHRVARDRAAQKNTAVDGAVLITQDKTAHWDQGMAIHALAVPAISAALTAAAARETAAAHERHEVEAAARETAAAREARVAQVAVAKKEAVVKALEQALAQERARKEAKMKAQADAAKQEAIETARRKVAEENAKTQAELRGLEAEKAQLQQPREREAARAHKEAERRAEEATAAAMEEAERKIRRETIPGGS